MTEPNTPIRPGAGGPKAPGLAGVVEHLIEEAAIAAFDGVTGEIRQQEQDRENHHAAAIAYNAERVEQLAAQEAAFEIPDVADFQ